MNSIIFLISVITVGYLSLPYLLKRKGRRYTLELSIDNSGYLVWKLMNIYTNRCELDFTTPFNRNDKFEKNLIIDSRHIFVQSVVLEDSKIAYSISVFEDDKCIYSENCYVTLKDTWGVNMIRNI